MKPSWWGKLERRGAGGLNIQLILLKAMLFVIGKLLKARLQFGFMTRTLRP